MSNRGRLVFGPLSLTAVLTAFLVCGYGMAPPGPQARAAGQKTGEQLYREACASCHGIDGRGVDQDRLGFDLPVPDFTDCSFATREPDSDWVAVGHAGGPARAFSRLMPAFGEALSVEEVELVTAHVRTFCPNKAWPRGELNLPRPLATEKAFPEDEAVFTTTFSAEGQGSISNKVIYEKRLGPRSQVEAVIPFGWREGGAATAGNWAGGLGDLAIAAKHALFHSSQRGSIFSVAGEVVMPTGDREKGFGKGTTILEPFAAYGQILPSNFFLHAQAGLELPTNTDRAEREGFWRLAVGRTFEQRNWGRAWSPMIEFLAARELKGGEKISWDVLPQLQFTLSTRQHIMFDIGVRLPLTDSGIRDTQIAFYLLWDWFDGGLREGW
ncbi:MAG: cytochrome c [Acidobacteria bacterium]|nr:MAG: cytochrome c [Acidobacteriota bacterium]